MEVQPMHSSKGDFISLPPTSTRSQISLGFLWKYFGVAQPASDHLQEPPQYIYLWQANAVAK